MFKSPERGPQPPNEKESSPEDSLRSLISEVETGEAARKIVDAAMRELSDYRNSIAIELEDESIPDALRERATKADKKLVEIEKALDRLQSK